jgi:hypothetical protein
LLISYFKKNDQNGLFNLTQFFVETVHLKNFLDEITKYLVDKYPNFKVHRVMYFNKNFDEYVDLHDSFVFSHLQKFKIICEVITKNALTFLLLIKNFLKKGNRR